MRVAVIGGGSFGTAMAQLLAGNGHATKMWAREPKTVEGINTARENKAYMPGFPLSPNLTATTSQEEALTGAELVVSATPSHATRDVFTQCGQWVPNHVPIVTVSKGIENGTLQTQTEVLEAVLPERYHPYLAVLSGPSFAKEIMQRLPTAVTVAANWDRVGVKVQEAFRADYFRTYLSRDVVGVQLGGALKNVIAIAAGCADGLGLGHNTRAALITRGLAEISRVAVKRGANPLTLSGLAGMGDLVLTCTGELSRNRTVGFALGKGRTLKEILAETNQVAEGVKTAKSARDLAQQCQAEMPICEQVYLIAHEDKPAKQAVTDLMVRAQTVEF
jgi:glycerol-3-phosphate dehydrogenase (NAD(P)+)